MCFVFVFCNFTAQSQILRGKVLSDTGTPIPYSTIYISEITSGFISNEVGEFQTHLKSGSYTLELRSLGYISAKKVVTIKDEDVTVSLTLKRNTIDLKEVEVNPSDEDPAYPIMRKAISKAPFYLYASASYHSKKYVKGSVKIEKIPSFMRPAFEKSDQKNIEGSIFVVEAELASAFKIPDNFTDTVLAYNSSVPEQIDSKRFAVSSLPDIYSDNFDGCISPLSANAFKYYKYQLEDSYLQDGVTISKIKIIPKRKNNELVTGDIYISEKDYSVFSLQLSTSDFGEILTYQIDYMEVEPSVYLPVSSMQNVNINVFGLKFSSKYFSSISYSNIQKNYNLLGKSFSGENTTEEKPLSERQQKALAKIEQITRKENLSNKDALKLARYAHVFSEPEEVTKERNTLQIEEKIVPELHTDSLADLRDSNYWLAIRTLPLTEEETESFQKNDSLLKLGNVKNRDGKSIEIRIGNDSVSSSSWWLPLLIGRNHSLSKNLSLDYEGLLLGLVKEYNFADGFWLGQKVGVTFKNDSNTRSLYISPSAYYTTARKSVVWNVSTEYNYAPMLLGKLQMSLGRSSYDIQNIYGTSRFLNSISSLLFGENVIRFYERQHFTLKNSIDIANGLRLNVGVNMENRRLLENMTGFHIWGKRPAPNYPDENYKIAFPEHKSSFFDIGLEYTPFHKYRVDNGRKIYVSSLYPTFRVDYRKAIPVFDTEKQSSYDRLEFSVSQKINLSIYNRLNYMINAGSFFNKEKLYAPDYFYATVNPLIITNRPLDNSYNLLRNYTFSDNSWITMDINWNSDYMLFKRLSFLQRLPIDESLHHHLFLKHGQQAYGELTYSIGWKNFVRLGVIYAYSNLNFKGVGFIASIKLF